MASSIAGWFTMNGKHIPYMKGESKAEAAKKYLDKSGAKSGEKAKGSKRIVRGKTVAEKKILDAAQTSSSKYNLSNIKVVIDPRGDLNIRTKDNRDICTLRRSLFSDSMIDDLRDMGYIKRASATGVHKKSKSK